MAKKTYSKTKNGVEITDKLVDRLANKPIPATTSKEILRCRGTRHLDRLPRALTRSGSSLNSSGQSQTGPRATAVALTASYHERDARWLGLPVQTPPADTWQDWVEKFGVDSDRVRGMESDDLAWLRIGEGHFHGPGPWPFGINAYPGREDNDLILWLPSNNAIITGDSLSDFGEGLDIQLGGRKHVTRGDVVRRLRSLLDLPVELVLPAHGKPQDRATLERVLF